MLKHIIVNPTLEYLFDRAVDTKVAEAILRAAALRSSAGVSCSGRAARRVQQVIRTQAHERPAIPRYTTVQIFRAIWEWVKASCSEIYDENAGLRRCAQCSTTSTLWRFCRGIRDS